MIRNALRLALALAGAAAGLACDEPTTIPAEVVRPEAALSIEPPRLRAGDPVEVRISLRTPPDHHLAPWPVPEVEGAWILDVESPQVQREPGQWLHRWRIRMRPRELGVLRWPDSTLRVVDAGDREIEVPLAGREFEVVAPPPALSERDGPFGMLLADPEPGGPGWTAVGAGFVGGALAALLGSWAWRHRRIGQPEAPPADGASESPEVDLFEWAGRELDTAQRAVGSEPVESARRAATTLRAFVARRFSTTIAARTTPELEAGQVPFAARSRWPWFLRVLRELDELRFRPRAEGDPACETERKAAAALDEARRFIEETRPGGRVS